VKVRRDGGWQDLLERRPLIAGAGARQDSAGPVLSTAAGAALPAGRVSVDRRGVVRVRGGWYRDGRLVRRGTFTYRPTASGVALRVSGARRGDRLRLLVFAARGASAGARRLTAGPLTLRSSEDLSISRRGGFASATAERLTRYELRTRTGRSGAPWFSWQSRIG
jgi:hypothetical protein